ncbi:MULTISPECIES: hypothetical protein [Jeotgalibaca]
MMMINGTSYIPVNVKTTCKSNNQITIKLNEYKNGTYVGFSKELIKALNGKNYIEIHQAQDLKSFLLVPVEQETDKSVFLPSNQVTVNRRTKGLVNLFLLFKKYTGDSTFIGEEIEQGIIFKLNKKSK